MIINKTNNEIISNKEIQANNIFSQARGLMFRKKNNLIMKFPEEKIISLHMFFVFYPIDVLIINENLEIVEIKKNFKPFTFYKSKNKGKYLIELGKTSKEIKIGNKISFQ